MLTSTQSAQLQALLSALLAECKFRSQHPIYRLPTPEELAIILASPSGADELRSKLERREAAILASEERTGDPFRYGCELDHWHHPDLLLGLVARTPDTLNRSLDMMARLVGVTPAELRLPDAALAKTFWTCVLLGGNRSGKSEYCAKRVVQHAMRYPETKIVCLAETLEASIQTQQVLAWKYLPAEVKALNGVKDRDGVFHVNHSLKGGFTLEKIILPNRSQVHFKTYNQPEADVEGWVLGNTDHRAIGAWADENCPLPWIQALQRRAGYYGSVVLWSYTPLRGITPAIKELVGDTAQTVMTLPAELLPGRVNVAGCPPGTMPYIQLPVTPGAVCVYFHSILNPFGSAQGTLYEGVKRLCEGRPSEVVQCLAYGYTRDTIGRAWPMFGAVNLIDHDDLPAEGTNYLITDPAGARNWFCLWVRVAPGDPETFYLYREWPDYARFGEWAMPSADAGQFDGVAGPAQKSCGYGYSRYKQLFLREETIPWREPRLEPDPMRRRILEEAWEAKPAEAPVLREPVYDRFIDPRAGRDERIAQKGGTCAIDELAKVDHDAVTGAVLAPAMRFRAAQGFDIWHGIEAVNTLLHWDPDRPFDPLMNSPRLFIVRTLRNTIWALNNYTAEGGERGGCKDPADCLRYMATSRLRHIENKPVGTHCMGSY